MRISLRNDDPVRKELFSALVGYTVVIDLKTWGTNLEVVVQRAEDLNVYVHTGSPTDRCIPYEEIVEVHIR